ALKEMAERPLAWSVNRSIDCSQVPNCTTLWRRAKFALCPDKSVIADTDDRPCAAGQGDRSTNEFRVLSEDNQRAPAPSVGVAINWEDFPRDEDWARGGESAC